MKKKYSILLASIVTLLILLNSSFFSWRSEAVSIETVYVSRVVDGDTLVLDDSRTIRLGNINTPEKGEPLSDKSKELLSFYENKSLQMKPIEQDKYGRLVADLFHNEESISLKIVEEGLATTFLVQEESLKEYADAERKAQDSEKGIWQHSEFYNCIKIEIDKYNEIVKLTIKCSSLIGEEIRLRDESRKWITISNISESVISIHSITGSSNSTDFFWGEKNIWNNDRDTAYIFDSENKFIFSLKYGY